MEIDKIKIISGESGFVGSSVTLNGSHLRCITGYKVEAGINKEIPLVTIDMILMTAEIDLEGNVLINGVPITEERGKVIYETLKGKYEAVNGN